MVYFVERSLPSLFKCWGNSSQTARLQARGNVKDLIGG